MEAYQKVIEKYPGTPEAEKSVELIKELSEINSHLAYMEVMKKFDEGKYDEAAKGFIEIIEKYPGTESEIAARANLGICYENLHEWRKAVETYDELMKMIEGNPDELDAYRFAKTHKEWIEQNRL